MPQEKKVVDKFKLIETIGVMQKALEDDVIDIGKISFAKMPSGFFNVTVLYHEIETVNEIKDPRYDPNQKKLNTEY